MGRRRRKDDEQVKLGLIVLAIVAITLILLTMMRIQRGLIGFILGGLAVALAIYWIRELYYTVKKEMLPTVAKPKKWLYDIIDEKDNITIVAEVPGPEEHVKVEVMEKIIKIYGGGDFTKEVRIPRYCELIQSSYINGILNVKLKKIKKSDEHKSPQLD